MKLAWARLFFAEPRFQNHGAPVMCCREPLPRTLRALRPLAAEGPMLSSSPIIKAFEALQAILYNHTKPKGLAEETQRNVSTSAKCYITQPNTLNVSAEVVITHTLVSLRRKFVETKVATIAQGFAISCLHDF